MNRINKDLITLKEKNIDWFYSIKKWFKYGIIQETINDGLGILLWKEKDNLLYNKEALWLNKEQQEERWQNILENTRKNIANILVWADFKQPWQNIKIIQWNKLGENIQNLKDWKIEWVYNIWYTDNLLLEDPFKNSNIKSVALWGAVWDCANISSFYKGNEKEIMWISHAWYAGLKNQVVEQLIDSYKSLIWRENIKKIIFDISPLAGINYEFEEEVLLKLFKNFFKKYDIDHIQDNIYKPYKNNTGKWYFMTGKLLERILLENGIEKKQLNFHPDDTTSYDNKWPSYRLHTLSKQWLYDWKNIPNSRMWVFNILRK